MGRRKGSKNKKTVELETGLATGGIDKTESIPGKIIVESKKPVEPESYMEKYNRPLPFTMRPFCFGAGIKPKE